MAAMRIETQFSIFLINTPGVLGAVTQALSDMGVNLYALSLTDSGEHGVLRIVCDDEEKARAALRETHDRWTEAEVLVMPIGNQPGAFSIMTKQLADSGVNVTYAYCTAAQEGGSTVAVLKCDDLEKAKSILAS